MISAFRFTDNVQRNTYRYVKVNKYWDCYDICYICFFCDLILHYFFLIVRTGEGPPRQKHSYFIVEFGQTSIPNFKY